MTNQPFVQNKRDRQKLQMKSVKPKAWSHQSELSSLKGKLVALHIQQNVIIEGQLLEADNFTVKVRTKRQNGVFDAIVFKSAVTYFHELNRAVREEMN